MAGLSLPEIYKVVNEYIGVSNGYLGDFSYNSHAEFYPVYCELDISPDDYGRTTRQRFIEILKTASESDQAKILRGVLQRFPVEAIHQAPSSRTEALAAQIMEMVDRLEGASPIVNPTPTITSSTVNRAISDAEQLLAKNGPVSAIDRVHTALHGYLQALCDSESIGYGAEDTIAKLYKHLRENHSNLQSIGARSSEIDRILKTLSSALDALGPIRNNSSLAHPNRELLEEPEAMLVVNAVRTMMHYFVQRMET